MTDRSSEIGGGGELGGGRRRRLEDSEHEPLKERGAEEDEDIEKKWARLAERLKRREDVEARLKKVEEEFKRKEAERAQAESERKWAEFIERLKKQEQAGAEVRGPAVTKSSTTEVTDPACGPAHERETRLPGGPEQSSDIEQKTPREVRRRERVFPERPTVEELDRAIRQHPHLEKSLLEERYEEAVEYCHGTYHRSREMGAYQKKPILIDHLERQEEARLVHELHVPPEAQLHRIAPEVVKEVLSRSEAGEGFTKEEQVHVVHELYIANPSPEKVRVHYAELYQVGVPLTADRFREIAHAIHESRAELEQALNQQLGLAGTKEEVRVAVCDDRLYYWTIDLSRERWENVLYNERMYFRTKEDKIELIDEMRKHLHIRGGPDVAERYLNDVIGQMSRVEGAAANRTRRYGETHYFDGEVIHLALDLKGMTLEDIKGQISHLGTSERGRISNPQFPEARPWRMRTVAIIESDGHLTPARQLRYFEDNDARKTTIYDEFSEFGDFRLKEYRDEERCGKVTRVDLPIAFGAMMKFWGVPPGDKAIHNRGLDESLINETPRVKIEYPREMIPQDGCFSGGHFSITRNNALHMGAKESKYAVYGIKSVVSRAEVDFVDGYGTPLPEGLGYAEGERKQLNVSEIRRIIRSRTHPDIETARRLLHSILENPNCLLEDEVDHIMKPLGIRMSRYPANVIYYIGSERLSVSWRAQTATKMDAIKWALIAPPNHPDKMSAVVKFMTENRNLVENAKQEVQGMGLAVHPAWEGIL